MADSVNVVGLFVDQERLDSARRELIGAGFDDDDMRVIGIEGRTETRLLEDDLHDLGAPDEDERLYLQKVRDGAWLLVLETEEDRSDQASAVIERFETVEHGEPARLPDSLVAPRSGVRSYRRL